MEPSVEPNEQEPGTLTRIWNILIAIPLLIAFLARLFFAYFIGGHGRSLTQNSRKGNYEKREETK